MNGIIVYHAVIFVVFSLLSMALLVYGKDAYATLLGGMALSKIVDLVLEVRQMKRQVSEPSFKDAVPHPEPEIADGNE